MTRATSIEAYRLIKENGLLSTRRWQVYDHLFHVGPLTRNELDRDLANGRPNPAYSRRLAELERMGVLTRVGERLCSVTGYRSELWDVTDCLPQKLPPRSASINKRHIDLLLTELRSEIEGGRLTGPFVDRWGWCLGVAAP